VTHTSIHRQRLSDTGSLAVVCAALVACRACASFDEAPSISDAGADGATAVDGAIAKPDGAVADAGDAVPGASCRALLTATPSLRGKNDVYAIAPGDAGSFRVFCDMTIDNGGWTLAGRSGTLVSGDAQPFGWASSTGSVDNSEVPYSLGVIATKLLFSEVLVGTQDGSRAYKFAVSPAFLTKYASTTVPTGTIVTLAGDCAPQGGPSMLKHAGATSLMDMFFLRDVPDLGQRRGLGPRGFDLADYDDCERGGLLDGAQGIIMVR
jgi:hypothetical protein